MEAKISDKIIEQILEVRNTGRTNMFDCNTVQWIANELELYDLVVFIEEHPERYIKFIFEGK
jgi:hypothetical protein